MNPFGRRTTIIAAAALAWAAGSAWGVTALIRHERDAGATPEPARVWPAGTSFTRAERPTILIFAHPRCPCMRATIAELDRLMAHASGRAVALVAFFAPVGAADGWARTDVWRSAAAIPGVTAVVDRGGVEAARFGSVTAGDAFLYDREGRLVFRGGITRSRGHEGDNAGRTAIEDFLLEGRASASHTSVYGCSLLGAPTRSDR